MHQTFEFRVVEDFAQKLFRDDEGQKLGSGLIRLIRISSDDPRLTKIGELQAEIYRDFGRSFFHGWNIDRSYTKEELNDAESFKLEITSTFEPCGEECGTAYDESKACPYCGAGAKQVSDLWLDIRKVPKNKDIARTIAGEIIVSQRLAELMVDQGFKGFEFHRVRHKARYQDDPIDLRQVPTGREILQKAEKTGAADPTGEFWVWLNRSENRQLYMQAQKEYASLKDSDWQSTTNLTAQGWHQLIAIPSVEILPPTHVGIDPFDNDLDGKYRCQRGDTIGLNLLSELWVSRQEFANCDIARTSQHLGAHRGLLRPEPIILISPRVWRSLKENKIKGFNVEIAHLD